MKLTRENVHDDATAIDSLIRIFCADDVAEAVQQGESVENVLYEAACEVIAVIVEAVTRLMPDGADVQQLVPDEDDAPYENDSDQGNSVYDAAKALLDHIAQGELDDDTAINMLCDLIDAQREQNRKLCAALKVACDMLKSVGMGIDGPTGDGTT